MNKDLDDFDKWILIQKWFTQFNDTQQQNVVNKLHELIGKKNVVIQGKQN